MANILANSDVFNNNTAIYLIKRFNFNENFEPRYSLLMLIVSASRANSGHFACCASYRTSSLKTMNNLAQKPAKMNNIFISCKP